MFATALTRLAWLKMTRVKNCYKFIDGNECPCADKLRRLYLTNPSGNKAVLTLVDIEIAVKKYEKCYNE